MYPMLRLRNRLKGIGGALGDAEPAGRFLDGETIYPASIPFFHVPMLDLSEAPRKPSACLPYIRLRTYSGCRVMEICAFRRRVADSIEASFALSVSALRVGAN